MLVGRLDGDLDGRPISLIAENGEVFLEVKNLRSLLTLRRVGKFNNRILTTYLERANIRLSVRVGRLMTIEVFPNPKYLARILIPRG